jgi:hypothetical protein
MMQGIKYHPGRETTGELGFRLPPERFVDCSYSSVPILLAAGLLIIYLSD